MKISLNWLKQYVDIELSVEELADKLTAIGHMLDKRPAVVQDDTVLDLEVRQNRSDCLSVVGIAREIAAVSNKKVRLPDIPLEIQNAIYKKDQEKVSIKILDDTKCHRFMAFRITNINPRAKTPDYVIKHLQSYGMKLIHPVVDITNYVMIELGEPLHAFDMREIPEGRVFVRPAKPQEQFTILGGKEVKLTTDDLVIANSKEVISLAGVIGGEKSGVSSDTTEILLEAATYNQASIRRTSMRHTTRTEASTRHEKFLHPHLAQLALMRCADLIIRHCGGMIAACDDAYPHPPHPTHVGVSLQEIERLGGIQISLQQAKHYLELLDFEICNADHSHIVVSVPFWRTDIQQEADLVEEVVRLYGYQNIPSLLPGTPPPRKIQSKYFDAADRVRDVLVALGATEQITEPLMTEHEAGANAIRLENSLNADKTHLRTSLHVGLMKALANHQKHGRSNPLLFEIGKIYLLNNGQPCERDVVAVLYHGDHHHAFFSLKGIAEAIAKEFQICCNLPEIRGIAPGTYFFQMELELFLREPALYGRILTHRIPNDFVDISCTVDSTVRVGEMIRMLQNIRGVEEVTVGEEPRVQDAKHKSVLLRIKANQSVIKKTHLQAVSLLEKKFNATIR
jgi:phenylalanyl-tRNA synthetase beta chain